MVLIHVHESMMLVNWYTCTDSIQVINQCFESMAGGFQGCLLCLRSLNCTQNFINSLNCTQKSLQVGFLVFFFISLPFYFIFHAIIYIINMKIYCKIIEYLFYDFIIFWIIFLILWVVKLDINLTYIH